MERIDEDLDLHAKKKNLLRLADAEGLPARHPGRGQNPSYVSAAGGVISTANDLVT